MVELPLTNDDQLAILDKEYSEAQAQGGPELQEATVRLIWGLVHSKSQGNIAKGVKLAEELLKKPSLAVNDKRELLYFLAVGQFRTGQTIQARRSCKKLLEDSPESNQAKQLLASIEDTLVKDGLVGVGLIGAVAGVAGLAIAALARR